MQKKALITFLFLLSLLGPAQAGFLIEPYGGWSFGIDSQLEGSKTNVDWSYYEVGGRAGWIIDVFALGIDYDWKNPKVKWDNGLNTEQKTTMQNIGVWLGGYWPAPGINLRVKYYFWSQWKASESDSDAPPELAASGDKYQGAGFGVDLGFRILDWLAINVEYTNLNYKELNGNKDVPQLKTSDFLVSLSLPFNLFTGSAKKPGCCFDE